LAFSPKTSGQERPRRIVKVRILNRRVVAPNKPIRVTQHDTIEFHWSSDEMVDLHLHGYNKKIQVRPGQPAIMVVRARASGRFPITSHRWGNQGHGHSALTYLEVYPR
jgi:hypothetical protein